MWFCDPCCVCVQISLINVLNLPANHDGISSRLRFNEHRLTLTAGSAVSKRTRALRPALTQSLPLKRGRRLKTLLSFCATFFFFFFQPTGINRLPRPQPNRSGSDAGQTVLLNNSSRWFSPAGGSRWAGIYSVVVEQNVHRVKKKKRSPHLFVRYFPVTTNWCFSSAYKRSRAVITICVVGDTSEALEIITSKHDHYPN